MVLFVLSVELVLGSFMRTVRKTCFIGHSKRLNLNSLSKEISLALNLSAKTQCHGFDYIILSLRYYSFRMVYFNLLYLVAGNQIREGNLL